MTKKPAKQKIGRPRLPPGKKREAPIGFRPTPDMRADLKGAAADKGRSMAQEIQSRLEETFSRDEADDRVREAVLKDIYDSFGKEKTFRTMRLLASMVQMVEQTTGKSWLEDPETNIWVNEMISEAINRYGPARTDKVPNIFEAIDRKKSAREALDIWQSYKNERSNLPGTSKKKRRTKKG